MYRSRPIPLDQPDYQYNVYYLELFRLSTKLVSEITPTDLIHRPSTINFSRGSCCYAYPARGECPAPVALQVSCDNNNRTVHHNLYKPAVLFVLHARSALCSLKAQA